MEPGSMQETITKLLNKHKYDEYKGKLLERNEKDHITWLNSVKSKVAGLWLTTSNTRGKYKIQNFAFQSVLCYRLFMNQPNTVEGVRCKCTKYMPMADRKGHHYTTSCKYGSGKFDTHNGLCREISNFLKSSGVQTKLEERGCFAGTDPITQLRPDISIPEGQLDHKKIILDVTVTCPMHAATKGQALQTGHHAQNAYIAKMNKYNELAEQNNLKFLPIVFETTGYMHEDAVKFLRGVAGMDDKKKDYATIAHYNYMMTSISVTLQKGLANSYKEGKIRGQGGDIPRALQYHYSRNAALEYADEQARNGSVLE